MKNEKFDLDKTNEKIESCGVNANTKRFQQLAEKTFLDFVKSRIGDHEVIFTDASILEHVRNFADYGRLKYWKSNKMEGETLTMFKLYRTMF